MANKGGLTYASLLLNQSVSVCAVIVMISFLEVVNFWGLSDLKDHQTYIRDLCVFCEKDWVESVSQALGL